MVRKFLWVLLQRHRDSHGLIKRCGRRLDGCLARKLLMVRKFLWVAGGPWSMETFSADAEDDFCVLFLTVLFGTLARELPDNTVKNNALEEPCMFEEVPRHAEVKACEM